MSTYSYLVVTLIQLSCILRLNEYQQLQDSHAQFYSITFGRIDIETRKSEVFNIKNNMFL